jgi:hypothetical protein
VAHRVRLIPVRNSFALLTRSKAPPIISTLSEKFTALNIPAAGISISLSKTLD